MEYYGLNNALTGRSHRSVECKARLKEAIDKSKDILGLPEDYLLGIMPGSNTGSLEAAMWCLLENWCRCFSLGKFWQRLGD